ncbi:IstB-like ATP binding protein [Paracoccus sp. J56]|nr:IstB-like ATP binding protein [Paracoccus sp. J56]
MDRAEIMAAMGELKLYGMRAAYDELMAVAVRRQHEPRQIVGELLAAEINEKKARSVKYQITTAKLPYAREIEEFTFDDTPINETLVRDLASGEFLGQQRNVVLVGGTGTGKTHISVAIASRHPQRRPGTLLQYCGSREQAGGRGPCQAGGPPGRTSHATRLRHPR